MISSPVRCTLFHCHLVSLEADPCGRVSLAIWYTIELSQGRHRQKMRDREQRKVRVFIP